MMGESDWWKNFFSGLWIEFQAKRPAKQSKEQVDFIERALKLPEGAKILDVPCGTGRHSLELARRGYFVTAVDRSEELMRFGREIADQEGLNIGWIRSDMRDIDFEGEFDAVICMWGSFGYFDDRDNLLFLGRVARALKGGGKFLMDTHTLETLYPNFRSKIWSEVDGIYVLQDSNLDLETQSVKTEWTIIKGDRLEEKVSNIKIYSYSQIIEMARGVGFDKFEAYSSIEFAPFTLGSKRLFFISEV